MDTSTHIKNIVNSILSFSGERVVDFNKRDWAYCVIFCLYIENNAK